MGNQNMMNKLVVITGGSSGIGLATAKLYVDSGAKVVVTSRSQKHLDSALRTLGGDTVGITCDVSKLSDIDNLYNEIENRYSQTIDILIANAGFAKFANVEDVDEDMFYYLVDTNFKGMFFTVQKALPFMKDGGSIVLLSSVLYQLGLPITSIYSATKAAVRSLTRSFTTALVPRKIRVNTVSPGPTDTNFYGALNIDPEVLGRLKETFIEMTPMKRLGNPTEVAKAIYFLASEEASFITGCELFVDGGLSQA
jgi:NAD(P)-dependent dehydrogenase (short-subunit alcohol dehydrogenase family)